MAEEQRNPFERGPYIQIAALCERVLRETDGVISLVRVVDRFVHQIRRPDAPQDMPEVRYPLYLVLSLKSGATKGRHEVNITPELPSGEAMPSVLVTVQLEGENKGVHFISLIDIPYRLEGLYWFNVKFDGVPLTRLPLEVRYSRLVTGSATGG